MIGKPTGFIGLFTACHNAVTRVNETGKPFAIAFNGFAWYSAPKSLVEDGELPVVVVSKTEHGVDVAASELLIPQENNEIIFMLFMIGLQNGIAVTRSGLPITG